MLSKKRISIIIMMVLVVLVGATTKAEASTAWKIGTIKKVEYDKSYKSYYIHIVDTNGEGWIIDIVKNIKYNKQILKALQKLLQSKQIEYKVDDMNTIDIHDDKIIEYRIIF